MASDSSPLRPLILALGANISGLWGTPEQAFRHTIHGLQDRGVHIDAISPLIHSAALGNLRQPSYLNAVLLARSSLPPGSLLRLAKRIEREAGRRPRGLWASRPLDIDILDYGGRLLEQSGKRTPGRLALPHPEIANRGFVLIPLAIVAPGWRHPRLGLSARDLLRRRPALRRGISIVAGPEWAANASSPERGAPIGPCRQAHEA